MLNEAQFANNADITGHGQSSMAQVEALQKALSISQNYGTTAPGSLSGGAALTVEDLSSTLKLVTHSLEHLKLWKDIVKDKMLQPVHEYNVQNSYGEEVPAFFAMGGTPTETTANYEREIVQCKYMGTRGAVQHNLTLIQAAHGPVVAREVKNKAIEILSRNERSMFEADSSINALEYDGINAQIANKEALSTYKATSFVGYSSANESVIIDARIDANTGSNFSADIAEDMALSTVNNFGAAMDCYMSTKVHSVFSKSEFGKQRTVMGAELTSGNRINSHTGSIDFRYKPSVFNLPKGAPLASAVSATAAPSVANLTSPALATSEFVAADAGTYSYRISSVYADGETLAAAEINGAVSAGDEVKIEITYTGSPLYFNVYRAPVGTTTGHLFVKRIPVAASGSAHSVDFNDIVPGTSKAFLLQHDIDVLCWKQLGSMIKYDLATIDTSYRWLQLMYGTPLVSAARKNVIVKNLAS